MTRQAWQPRVTMSRTSMRLPGTEQRYRAGNNIYRHGSSFATAGALPKDGYIERDLRRRRLNAIRRRLGI